MDNNMSTEPDLVWGPLSVGHIDTYTLNGVEHCNLSTLTPARLKQLSLDQLVVLAEDIRVFLIAMTSQHGGHVGANTGVIELTLALHYVFSSPHDPILFDTGHIGYTHRIVTGRADRFPTLNQWQGMSRFLERSDSPHDVLSASHAGTALSTAVGLAQAIRMAGDTHRVIAVVGDGTLGEGSTWEGLNFLAGTDLPVTVVLNNNGMAIPPTVGGIVSLTRDEFWKDHSEHFFSSLGFRQVWTVENGHNIHTLIEALQSCHQRWQTGPAIIHVKTEKGHGLPCAATHAYKMHFSGPFDPLTGAGASPTISGRTFATVAADTLATILAHDPDVVVLTPGTPYASALEPLMAQYPDRVVDTGMAEQHTVSMAAGLAIGGKKPVICMQSTFLQRAYDQIIHDVCYPSLPVTFLLTRSGFAGYDSPTHHGLYDIPVLRSFPRLQLHYAMDTHDLTTTLTARLAAPSGPMALLMPYEPVVEPEPALGARHAGWAEVCHGTTGVLFCLGNTLVTALAVRQIMAETFFQNYGVVCVGQLAPLPAQAIRDTLSPFCCPHYVTIEEGAGGFGALLRRHLDGPYVSWLHCDTEGLFVPAGSKDECATWARVSPMQIVDRMLERWGSVVL